jgi:coenzyme F420-reducing hydrogenase beta subunit
MRIYIVNKTNQGIRTKQIKLFKEKKNCCGCGACLNVCPKCAIIIKEDEYGYLYPFIDETKCIGCRKCENICAYQNKHKFNISIKAYAAIGKDKKILLRSSSGGIFASFATDVINNQGIVYGCAFNDKMEPKHIGINNLEDLHKLQGSKYVQSDIKDIFYKIEKNLLDGMIVLFSGTPCQVDALKFYLKKDYDNLITIDIVCHGVPNSKFFKEYISLLEKKMKTKIIDFKFRDKEKGWGFIGAIIYKKNNRNYKKFIISSECSYYTYFLKSEIYRESCYNCKYACKDRVGDFTIGDYWGINEEHPGIFDDGKISIDNGVSLLIINTAKAEKYLLDFQKNIILIPSDLNKMAKQNKQLTEYSKYTSLRKTILEIYKKGGYEAIEKFFRKNVGLKIYMYKMKKIMPLKMKSYIKMLIK